MISVNAKSKKVTGRTKAPMSNKKFLGIWVPLLSLATALVVLANVAINVAGGWVASQLGSGTYTFTNVKEAEGWNTKYYTSEYASIEDVDAAAKKLVSDIAAGGIVLAKNTGKALPLTSGKKVTMLGRAAADPVFGGAGSGSVDTRSAVTARAGLEQAGLVINDKVLDAISAFSKEKRRGHIEMDLPDKSSYTIGELPIDQYKALQPTFADYADAAIVFIGRPGGEGGDLTRDMTGWDDNAVKGQHQLELNKDERDLINLAKSSFDKVVVVVNSSTTMELGDVQKDSGVDAVLLIGSPGASGFSALGAVLAGDVNPSGKTADVWAADFTKDPTYANFGSFIYTNISASYPVNAVERATSNAVVTHDAPFVTYAEGIYLGYRYYETAAAERFINYDDAVVYPFGYGLSYTDFAWKVTSTTPGPVDGVISVEVEVTNTGTVAGKDVVELYYTAPYQRGGIEKPEVVLGDFAKTDLIEPGKSQTVTLTIAVEDMASYDYSGKKAYVLEAGNYVLSLRTDSHTPAAGVSPITYPVSSEVVYSGDKHRASDKSEVTNRFDDVSEQFAKKPTEGKVVGLSRADFAGTFPHAPTKDLFVARDSVIEAFKAWDDKAQAGAFKGAKPATGKNSDLTLIDMRGLAKDDPKWQELLDSLTVDEMRSLLLNGAYQTPGIGSIGKPQTLEPDGPAGFSSFINSSINGVAYPSEFLIAQTWDIKLAAEMGRMLGNEALHKGINGWYAPAANLHRSPFGGRNFEYYSEDPYLSGKMLTSVANGIAEKGVYTMLKHFALNEQETERVNNGVATFANEQAIRELYLKPFEMAVKKITMEVPYVSDDKGTIATTKIGAAGIMSSFNRIGATWAGGSKALMTDVLRGEWGFKGFAISDFNLYPYMNPNQAISAGTDLTLTFQPSKSFSDTTSAKAVADMRKATFNILYTVANSNAMNGLAPGATVTYTPPTWVYVQWIATGVLGALILTGAFLVWRRTRRHSAPVAAAQSSS